MTGRMRFSAAMAALLALQPVAIAQLRAADPSSAANKSGGDAAKPKVKKICHRETPTGSIKPVRICRTQDELDSEAQRAQARLDDMNRMSQQTSTAASRGF